MNEHITAEHGGTHASPRMHRRRGHNRRVVIGEGRTDRKWVFIPGTWVNAQNNPEGGERMKISRSQAYKLKR